MTDAAHTLNEAGRVIALRAYLKPFVVGFLGAALAFLLIAGGRWAVASYQWAARVDAQAKQGEAAYRYLDTLIRQQQQTGRNGR